MVSIPFSLTSANNDEVSYPCYCPEDSDGTECGGNDICLVNKGQFINGPAPDDDISRGPASIMEINIDTLREALKAEGLTEKEIKRVEMKINISENEFQGPNG